MSDTVNVPKEPTREMIEAGAYALSPDAWQGNGGGRQAYRSRRRALRAWKAMIHAAEIQDKPRNHE